MIVPIELCDIFKIWRAEKKKYSKKMHCASRTWLDFLGGLLHTGSRDQNVCGKTIDTNNRNVFDAVRYRRNTRNLVNRGTDSLRSSIIRKTFRSCLYKRLEKFTPTHRRDTCTVLGNLSNIVLCIESWKSSGTPTSFLTPLNPFGIARISDARGVHRCD